MDWEMRRGKSDRVNERFRSKFTFELPRGPGRKGCNAKEHALGLAYVVKVLKIPGAFYDCMLAPISNAHAQ